MKIKINFFAVMLFLSMVVSGGYQAIITFLSAALHELGHIFAAKMRGIKLNDMNIGILGARLSMPYGLCSYKDEVIVCIAGPAVNILSVTCCCILKSGLEINNELYEHFILSSFALGILNLLPIKSFDGGRIVFSIISGISNERIAERAIGISSFAFLFILWSISLYLLLKITSSLSLFIFSISLFANFFIDSFDRSSRKDGIPKAEISGG